MEQFTIWFKRSCFSVSEEEQQLQEVFGLNLYLITRHLRHKYGDKNTKIRIYGYNTIGSNYS